jgi:hypothetical protein
MATESYVNVSTGYAAGYSGLLRHVMTNTLTDNKTSLSTVVRRKDRHS